VAISQRLNPYPPSCAASKVRLFFIHRYCHDLAGILRSSRRLSWNSGDQNPPVRAAPVPAAPCLGMLFDALS
jgi:hypothetical protein